ncbi:MAG: hypothetical protein WC867_04420 [Candidatus Pacearchaeota archaeon]|jgi:hypothetical protein
MDYNSIIRQGLDDLIKNNPDEYAARLLADSFYSVVSALGLYKKIEEDAIKEIGYADYTVPGFGKRIHELTTERFKGFYYTWARINNHPEELLDLGWQKFHSEPHSRV